MCAPNQSINIKSAAHFIRITWFVATILFAGVSQCSGNDEESNLAYQLSSIIQRLFPMIPSKAKYPWIRIQLEDSNNLFKTHHSNDAIKYPLPVHINGKDPLEPSTLLNSDDLLLMRSRDLPDRLAGDYDSSASSSSSIGRSSSVSSSSLDQLQPQPLQVVPSTAAPHPRPLRRKPQILGKRGPECMRRCIAQGILHPVQCHSLC